MGKEREKAMLQKHKTISFVLGGVYFEYDEAKEKANIIKHGISFRTAARVFFDADYIEESDDDNEYGEQRYDVIGDVLYFESKSDSAVIGSIIGTEQDIEEILYVVYTERRRRNINGRYIDIIRLISARMANEFERGLYYGKKF